MHEHGDPRQYHQMRQNGQDGDGQARDWIGRNEYLALIEHLAVTFHSIAPPASGRQTERLDSKSFLEIPMRKPAKARAFLLRGIVRQFSCRH
jgi:hypothetical protein